MNSVSKGEAPMIGYITNAPPPGFAFPKNSSILPPEI
jgi:hypothetical protein